ncbi:neuronal alpha-10 acetylcholine receptor subunit, partial [Mytilus galloprovincialis]
MQNHLTISLIANFKNFVDFPCNTESTKHKNEAMVLSVHYHKLLISCARSLMNTQQMAEALVVALPDINVRHRTNYYWQVIKKRINYCSSIKPVDMDTTSVSPSVKVLIHDCTHRRMDLKINFLLIIVWHAILVDVECVSTTKQIYDAIFTGYDSGLRPICDGVPLVNLTIGVAVRQLIDLDEPNQVMKINLWIRLKWTDCLLRWDPSGYDNTDYIVVPIAKVWTPDLTLYDRYTNTV